MPEKKITLCLNYLHCYFVEEENYDDVFLKYKGKRIWPRKKKQQPVKMDTSTALNVEITGISLGQQVEIELWDFDWLSSNDLLGVFKMEITESIGPFTTDMIRNPEETNKAKYTLEWEIF